MKLEKFTKNKKQKQIVIGSIVGILLLIGGISLYQTFALYKEEKTFDVLQGTVPDFRNCLTLGGATPIIKEGLVPVAISDTGVVTKVSKDSKDWYNYCDKEWANAVILTSDGEKQNIQDGKTIDEKYIESYFVWIPKYSYKIFNMNEYETVENVQDKGSTTAIEIKFGLKDTIDDDTKKECKTPNVSGENGQCDVGDWMTHPAFSAFPNSHGMWVGKFETGYKQDGDQSVWTSAKAQSNTNESSKVIIKPNVFSWRSITVGNAFTVSFNYQKSLVSHMMKNTEWGAVAYLTQSIYGRCTKNEKGTSCEEITKNNNSNFVTGFAGASISQARVAANPKTDITGTYNYENKASSVASTTKNYTGIYDMSGGAWEQMAGVKTNAKVVSNVNLDNIIVGLSELKLENIENIKYIDLYLYNYKRILGDAISEMGPFGKKNDHTVSSWYEDWGLLTSVTTPWIVRGGYAFDVTQAGVFASSGNSGAQLDLGSFRIVLTP